MMHLISFVFARPHGSHADDDRPFVEDDDRHVPKNLVGSVPSRHCPLDTSMLIVISSNIIASRSQIYCHVGMTSNVTLIESHRKLTTVFCRPCTSTGADYCYSTKHIYGIPIIDMQDLHPTSSFRQ